jgi:hypothetical protein
MTWRPLCGGVLLGAVLLGCGSAASASPPVAPAPSAAASPVGAAGGIVLDRTPAIGCDSIGVDYTSATIRIDPASDPDVWAETAAPKKLAVKWTDGFSATNGSSPMIVGPKGEEVAHNGTKIDVLAAAYPRLAGYFVCLAPDALYVLETDPQ